MITATGKTQVPARHLAAESATGIMAAGGSSEHTRPVYLINNQLPAAQEKPYSVAEICSAAEKSCGFETIEGAQHIRGLWRIYPKTTNARVTLPTKGLILRSTLVTPKDDNPFLVRENNPNGDKEVPTTKLIVGDIPISCSNDEIVASLDKLKVKQRSRVIEEKGRDDKGKLTRWKTGRRIIYIDIPEKTLPKQVNVGIFRATLYYKEMRVPTCSKCLTQGHHSSICDKPVKCKQCFKDGHVAGSADCQLPPSPPHSSTETATEARVEKKYTSIAARGASHNEANQDLLRCGGRETRRGRRATSQQPA